MELSTATGNPIMSPSPEEIESVLAGLPGGLDSFAILSQSELTYMQAAKGSERGFVLEYQTGSIDQHYWSAGYLPLPTVTEAFQLYAVGDPSWINLSEWEKKEISQNAAGTVPILVLALVIVAGIFWWWRAST
jgi:hypothetical protein